MNTLRASRRTCLRALSSSARRTLRTPGALGFTAIFYLMVTTVLTALWSAAAGDGEIAGYSAVALGWYVVCSEAATIPLDYRLIETTGDDIARGDIAVELLRPTSVLWTRVFDTAGTVVAKLVVCAAAGVAFSTVVSGAAPAIGPLLLAAPALCIALFLNVVAQHAFAAAAFWVDDAKGTWFLYQKAVFVLGGMLLPIEVLPDAIQGVARLLPFASMAYVPARLASGHWEPQLLGLQLFWLAAIGLVTTAIFSAGERRLQVTGG